MTSVAEVVISAKPQGVDDVESGLQRVENQTEDTKQELEDTSEQFGGLEQRFRGGMAAIVGGLAIAATGLLSQIPVIQESADGIGAIIDSVALKLDSTLRPALNGANNELFDTADAVSQAEGPLDAIKTALFGIGDAAQIAAVEGLKGAIKDIFGIKVPDGFLELPLNVLQLDAQGVKNNIEELFDVDLGENIVQNIITGIQNKAGSLKTKAQNVAGDAADKFNNLVNSAKQWGKDIINDIVSGIEEKAGNLKSSVGSIKVAGDITVNDIADETFSSGGGGGGGDNSGNDFIGAVSNSAPKIFLDGTKLNDQVGFYRKDALNRRG